MQGQEDSIHQIRNILMALLWNTLFLRGGNLATKEARMRLAGATEAEIQALVAAG